MESIPLPRKKRTIETFFKFFKDDSGIESWEVENYQDRKLYIGPEQSLFYSDLGYGHTPYGYISPFGHYGGVKVIQPSGRIILCSPLSFHCTEATLAQRLPKPKPKKNGKKGK